MKITDWSGKCHTIELCLNAVRNNL
jgi:hypothetical protein